MILDPLSLVFLGVLVPAMVLAVATEPLVGDEAKATHVCGLMDESHCCYTALDCKRCRARPQLRCVTDRAHGLLGWGGSRGLLTGLRRGYSVPHQGSPEFEPPKWPYIAPNAGAARTTSHLKVSPYSIISCKSMAILLLMVSI